MMRCIPFFGHGKDGNVNKEEAGGGDGAIGCVRAHTKPSEGYEMEGPDICSSPHTQKRTICAVIARWRG